MSETLSLSKPQRVIHVGVILVNSRTEILDVAQVDSLSAMTDDFLKEFPDGLVTPEMKAQALPFKFHWVSADGKSKNCSLTAGISLQPTDSYETCPPLDIVIMGASEIRYQPTEADLAFIRKSYEQCSAFIAICGGFQLPLQAGLYEGKTVTGPRPMLSILRQSAPGATWVEKRWARDGKLWMSGALLNGMDLMYAFATHYWGGEDSLVDRLAQIGAWPVRDIDYNDVAWIY